jgi:uncharacterized protein
MRLLDPSVPPEGPETSSQAIPQAEDGSPARGSGAQAPELVLIGSQGQQKAERYSQELPLALCHGCDGCGMRCTEGVRMTRVEFLRVEQFLEAHPAESTRVASQDKTIPDWPVTRFCQFRDTELNRCFIYPVRPVICRLFGHTEWLPCPLEIVPLRGQDAMDVYQEYAAEEIRTYDEWRRERPVLGDVPQTDEDLEAD